MAKPMRRAVSEEDKSLRRDAILAAAKKVFAKKGFHATTMADIAKAARLSYGSVYWYFDSKDALFHALKTGRPSWWIFVIMGSPLMGCVI